MRKMEKLNQSMEEYIITKAGRRKPEQALISSEEKEKKEQETSFIHSFIHLFTHRVRL